MSFSARLREEVRKILQVGDVLWKRDDVLFEARDCSQPLTEITSTPQVADADLHVVERNKHGLDDGCILREVEPLPVSSADVEPEERVPVVPRRESCDFR